MHPCCMTWLPNHNCAGMDLEPESKGRRLLRRLTEKLREGHVYEIGDKLREVHRKQRSRGVSEYYKFHHLVQACKFYSKKEPSGFLRQRLQTCGKLGHDSGCTLCTTCHFCRRGWGQGGLV